MHRIYHELASWYRLLDPCDDHRDEAAAYRAAFERAIEPKPRTMLELGAGAGNNAFHLKSTFHCTLSDLSESMLALSRESNPECEHLMGDMRTLRLGKTFDAVLAHDSVVYLLTEEDLQAAARTAFVHTRPGGAAIFAPDCVRETFCEFTQLHEGQEGNRALRCIDWTWDPDPTDDTCMVEYALVLRDGTEVRTVHDRHEEGIFPIGTWRRILSDAGFEVEMLRRPVDEGAETQGYCEQMFLCRR